MQKFTDKRGISRLAAVLAIVLILVMSSFSAALFLEKQQVSVYTLTVQQDEASSSITETVHSFATVSATTKSTEGSSSNASIVQTLTVTETTTDIERDSVTEMVSASPTAESNSTLVACAYTQGGKICTYQYNSVYSYSFNMANGAGCGYGGNTPYLMNGSVLAHWNYLMYQNDTRTNFFALGLENYQLYYENGSSADSMFNRPGLSYPFTGTLPFNLTDFTVLSNQTVVLNTKQVSTQFNPCFPYYLTLAPS